MYRNIDLCLCVCYLCFSSSERAMLFVKLPLKPEYAYSNDICE